MTIEAAIQVIRRTGSITSSGGRIRYRVAKSAEMYRALEVIAANREMALDLLTGAIAPSASTSVTEPNALKGSAVELWADTAGGRVWIVADEEDALLAKERLGAHRGEIWTRAEIEQVVRINDRSIAQELAALKRRFHGAITMPPETPGKSSGNKVGGQ